MQVSMLRSGMALVLVLSLSGCASLSSGAATAGADDLERGRRAWIAEDYSGAVSPLKAAAGEGNARARYALGYMYFHGRGVERDRGRGIELIRRAADQGDEMAIEALGRIANARPAGSAGAQATDRPRTTEQILKQKLAAQQSRQAGSPAESNARQPDADAARQPAADAVPEPTMVMPETGRETANGWLAGRAAERYTIELLAVRDYETVNRYREQYLRRNPPPEPVKVLEVQRKGRRWLLLVMGNYPDADAARRIIADLPPLLRAGNPSSLRFGAITAAGEPAVRESAAERRQAPV